MRSVPTAIVFLALSACSTPAQEVWPAVGAVCNEVRSPSPPRSAFAGAFGPRTALLARTSNPLMGPNDVISVWICESGGWCWPVVSHAERVPTLFRWQEDGSLLVATTASAVKEYAPPTKTVRSIPPPPVRVITDFALPTDWPERSPVLEGVGEEVGANVVCSPVRDFSPR